MQEVFFVKKTFEWICTRAIRAPTFFWPSPREKSRRGPQGPKALLRKQTTNKSASVYSVFDEGKIALSKFRSSEPVRKSLNL